MTNDELMENYPDLLEQVGYLETPAEWAEVLDELFSKLDELGAIRVLQCKEKFGGLRVYIDHAPTELYEQAEELIRQAEREV